MAAKNPELFAEILSRPDDERPRREYARWLETQGEAARAEVIDVQLKLAKIHYSPRSPAMDDLRAREKRLLDAGASAWRSEIETPVTSAWLVRGFFEHAALPAPDFVKVGAALLKETPLLHLDLENSKACLPELAACAALSHVRSLDLANSGLDDADLAILAASPHLGALRWLGLERNPFGVAGVGALAASKGFPVLRVVLFGGSQVNPMRQAVADWDGTIVDTRPTAGSRAIEDVHGRQPWLDPYAEFERPNRYVV